MDRRLVVRKLDLPGGSRCREVAKTAERQCVSLVMIKECDPGCLVEIVACDGTGGVAIGQKILEHFLVEEEFISFFPALAKMHFIVHLKTPELAQRFRDLGKTGSWKKTFRVVEVCEEIILTRVRGDISEEEIRNLLFPPSCGTPSLMGEPITERKKLVPNGPPLWFTGRRIYRVERSWFLKVRHLLPSHLCDGKRKIFVHFTGAKPKCFGCGSTEHLVKSCSQKSPPPPPAAPAPKPNTSTPKRSEDEIYSMWDGTSSPSPTVKSGGVKRKPGDLSYTLDNPEKKRDPVKSPNGEEPNGEAMMSMSSSPDESLQKSKEEVLEPEAQKTGLPQIPKLVCGRWCRYPTEPIDIPDPLRYCKMKFNTIKWPEKLSPLQLKWLVGEIDKGKYPEIVNGYVTYLNKINHFPKHPHLRYLTEDESAPPYDHQFIWANCKDGMPHLKWNHISPTKKP